MEEAKESKRIVVSLDNTEMLKSLDEVEKKLDVLNEKANRLKTAVRECNISVDLGKEFIVE